MGRGGLLLCGLCFQLVKLSFSSSKELEREEYELLCPDGSAAPLTAYSTCNLGNGPGRAIVTRRNLQKIVKKFLKVIQVFPGR